MEIDYKQISKCRICGSTDLTEVLDLGMQPWGNDFREMPGEAKKYPLQTVFCNDCSTFQVKHNVPKEIMYDDHTYLSGANQTMYKHFESVSQNVLKKYNKTARFVVDIGSNDGTLLKTYKEMGLNVLGVEPCSNISEEAIASGIPTLIDFFNNDVANKIIKDHGNADIISAANVFYHVEELHDIVKGIKNLLSSEGVFIVQGTYLPNLIENNEFDIIYHEHLLYYRIENLNFLLKKYDLEIFDLDFAEVHGGSFIAYICHKGKKEINNKVNTVIDNEISKGYNKIGPYLDFASRVKELKKNIQETVKSILDDGKTIYAYGAPVKGTVMMNYCELDSSMIPIAAEVNKAKINKYIPGVDVEVLEESTLDEPDYYFLLSWNFLEHFKKSEKYLSGKRKFIVPIPDPHIVKNQ